MKLKKIIASLTAAAMAVTTMAFAPLSVSADNEPPEGKETVLGSFVTPDGDSSVSFTGSWQSK